MTCNLDMSSCRLDQAIHYSWSGYCFYLDSRPRKQAAQHSN